MANGARRPPGFLSAMSLASGPKPPPRAVIGTPYSSHSEIFSAPRASRYAHCASRASYTLTNHHPESSGQSSALPATCRPSATGVCAYLGPSRAAGRRRPAKVRSARKAATGFRTETAVVFGRRVAQDAGAEPDAFRVGSPFTQSSRAGRLRPVFPARSRPGGGRVRTMYG